MLASLAPAPRQPENVASRLQRLNVQAWELRSRDAKRAEELASEALTLATSLKDKSGLAHAYLARGYARYKLSHWNTAQQDAEEARLLFETLNDRAQLLETLNVLGIIYGETGKLEGALETFLSNYKLCNELSKPERASVALNNAAIIYNLLGDYTSALEHYTRALELCQTLGYREGTGRAIKNIGATHLEMKHYHEALEYFHQALSFKEVTDEPQLHSYTLVDIGRCHKALGNTESALTYVSKGLQLAELIENRTGIADALDELGALHLERGDLSNAQVCLDRALWLRRDLNEPQSQMFTQLHRSKLFLQQDKLGLALSVLQEALELAQSLGSKAGLYQTHLALSETYEKLQDIPLAFQHHKRYVQLKDDVFNEASSRILQSLRVTRQVEKAEQEREIYRLRNVELAQANEQLHRLDAQKSRLLGQLKKQAQEDALTGLFNRRYFDERLKSAFQEALEHDLPLSVMLCDIDNFKRINDTFSHQVGDKVLTVVAKLLREGIRESDVLARYGGEEFILLMPGARRKAALDLCERLRKRITTYDWAGLESGLVVTLSLGVSSDLSSGNHEKLTALADKNLYEAKRLGKNRVQG
jgi:diguanylate cyclase (GGDEF)-like protein